MFAENLYPELMITIQKYMTIQKKAILFACFCVILSLLSFTASAQEDPPIPLQVSTFQNLSFGAVIQGNTGGTVIIDPQGSRTVTGDLIPVNLGYQYAPAIFEIEGNPGAIVSIVNGPDATLTGNGGTLTMHIGTSIPASPFINTKTAPSRTQIRIGGTLYVGNQSHNPSGNYIGNFSVTFVQQ